MNFRLLVFFWLSSILIGAGSCGQKAHPPLDSPHPSVGFNNDSAKNALLVEYNNSNANFGKAMIDTSYGRVDVDFSEVFPVIVDNCVPCHHQNGNGPFVLTNYEAVLKRSAMIKEVMMQRIMPPFLADAQYSSMINAPRMNDSTRWRIVNWIDQGALPAKKTYDKNLHLNEHASKLDKTRTYYAKEHVINSNTDSYQCFVIDLNLLSDSYVRSFRYHSSNPGAIHHIMVYLDTLGILDTLPTCWNCMQDDVINQLIPIDSWSKGMVAYTLTEDFAFRFPKGSKLLFQTHYGDEGNKGQKERTRLDITFDEKPKREVKFDIQNNLEIFFPANTVKVETIQLHTDSAISLIGCVPHVHFLGRRMEIFAITPENKKINILKINTWDYLWQGSYLFKNLIVIPAKSTIYMNTVFDNTAHNPAQPNHPIRDVKYDTYSNEEMMVLCLYITGYKKGDENINPLQILR